MAGAFEALGEQEPPWTGPDGRLWPWPPPDDGAGAAPRRKDSGASAGPPRVRGGGLFAANRNGLAGSIHRLRNREALRGVEVVFAGVVDGTGPAGPYVVYQMEQSLSKYLCPEHPDFDPRHLQLLARAEAVWDFSQMHVEQWRRLGLRAAYVPLCCTVPREVGKPLPPVVVPPPPDQAQTDVLLFGTLNERRMELEGRLRAAGFRAVFKRFEDEAEQERAIESARLVLNVHFYPDAALEVHRINPLLVKGVAVLSEPSGDPGLDAVYASAVAFAPYYEIVSAVRRLLEDPEEAQLGELRRRGREFVDGRTRSYPHELHAATEMLAGAPAEEESSCCAGEEATTGAKAPVSSSAVEWDRWLQGHAEPASNAKVFELLRSWQQSQLLPL